MPSILITGVSTGIGRSSAELFAAKGWNVTGTVRDTGRAPELAGDIALEALDLSVPGSALALAERMLAGTGCPDVLLNNAGTLQWGPIETIGADELARIYQVNVFGQLELIQGLLPAMRERRSGTIANVTSLGGRMVFPFFGVYNSTKHALEGISEGLWHELKPFGIKVKAIEPGYVATPIYDKAMKGSDGAVTEGPAAYAQYMRAMTEFESEITKRTTPDESGKEVYAAVTDGSDRLRYPIAAYADPILRARRAMGDQFMMRFFHEKWMGKESG